MTSEVLASPPTPAVVSRRRVVGTGAGLAGAAAVSLTPALASAATFTPATSTYAPLPTAQELHTLRRWTYGYTPQALASLRAAGGPQQWFAAQLAPDTVTEVPASAVESWWPAVTATPEQIVQRDKDKTESGWSAMASYARYALVKRATSNRSVLELMAEFWADHFYIPRNDDGVYPFRIDFGQTLHRLALTSVEELLQAATIHPAMSCSLDNAGSRKTSVNENLGRELLELHTVGVGNYSEEDVKNSARLLTGFRVDMWSTWKVYDYFPDWHWVGPVQVMGFSHPNASTDGRGAVRDYLTYLARHPATARRVCRKLAQRFVTDDPTDTLVERLAEVYLANGTRVVPVLQALFAAAEFTASAGQKVKTPTDEVTSLIRATGVQVARPTTANSGANVFLWSAGDLGAEPWSHPRPDGPPRTNEAWVNASRFLGSWSVHWNMAGGWWPSLDVTWVQPVDRLPATSLSLAELVDHLSRTLLGEASTSQLLEACCTTTGAGPTATVTRDHAVVKWMMPDLVALVLNQPSFYLR